MLANIEEVLYKDILAQSRNKFPTFFSILFLKIANPNRIWRLYTPDISIGITNWPIVISKGSQVQYFVFRMAASNAQSSSVGEKSYKDSEKGSVNDCIKKGTTSYISSHTVFLWVTVKSPVVAVAAEKPRHERTIVLPTACSIRLCKGPGTKQQTLRVCF